MKVTLKQLQYKCIHINRRMRSTLYGVVVDRTGEEISVTMLPRRTGWMKKLVFTGSAKEVDAYLSGLVAGVGLDRVGDEEDGTDA